MSERVHASSIIFRALSRSAASCLWKQNRRRAGGESEKKNGKWKHVFLTEQAVPQRGTDKDLPAGECGG